MKKKFEPCEITIIHFENDVITTSGEDTILRDGVDWKDRLD